MIKDPIVEEIRQHRRAHAAEHGDDLGRIVQASANGNLLNPNRAVATLRSVFRW